MGEVSQPARLPPSPQPPIAVWGSIVTPRAAGPQRPTAHRYLELDGYRGVAVLGIVVYHVYQYCNVHHYLYGGTAGYTILNSLDAAVPFFFVISAFVLFEPIARDLLDGRAVTSPGSLLRRRALRLLPVYLLAVAVAWFPRQSSLPGDWRDLLEHLTFTQVFDPKRIFYTIGPAWSVSVAVYFSLLLAVLVAALSQGCRRLPDRRSRAWLMIGLIAAVAVVSIAWIGWSYGVRHRPTDGSFTTWFGPLASLDEFAVGMGVAVLVALRRRHPSLGGLGTTALRTAALVLLVVAFETRQIDTWPAVVFASACAVAFGCLVTAAALGTQDGGWTRAVSWPPLRWLGAISLSVYLWHEPVLLALGGARGIVQQQPGAFARDLTVVLLGAIAVGWLSYVLVERPTHRLASTPPRESRSC